MNQNLSPIFVLKPIACFVSNNITTSESQGAYKFPLVGIIATPSPKVLLANSSSLTLLKSITFPSTGVTKIFTSFSSSSSSSTTSPIDDSTVFVSSFQIISVIINEPNIAITKPILQKSNCFHCLGQ